MYDYLLSPGKENLIQDILEGKVAKVRLSELDEGSFLTLSKYEGDKNLTICIRTVYSDFEAVKLAYGEDVPIEIPFLQLYVLGDDFALENEYYYGGVTW